MDRTRRDYLLFGAIAALTFILVVLLTDKVKSREDMSFSRALDTVNIGTTANDGTGDPLRTAFAKINDVIIMLDSLDLDEVTGSLNYSTENYGTTGMGNIVLSDGATITNPTLNYPARPTGTVSAATGITAAMLSRMIYFNTAAAINITANPQIANGANGQIITIIGSSDTNTLTLDDTDGLRLTGQCILGIGDNITLLYEGTIGDWIEISRSNN